MSKDIETGRRIARQCKQMHIRTLATLIEQELDYDRFDYDAGETDMIIAVLTTYHGYIEAGGTVDFGWRIEQQSVIQNETEGRH